MKQLNVGEMNTQLSELYRQKTDGEWQWLQINSPEWWQRRVELENIVDGHFMAGKTEAAREPFFQLVGHLKTAPIDELSSRVAREVDGADPKRSKVPTKAWKPRKLPGHPEAWDGTRIGGREYFNSP